MKPNKITPQVYKTLVETAAKLPPFQRKDKNGNLLWRAASRFVKGSELTQKVTADGKAIKPDEMYVQQGRQPLLVNHQVNLIEVYMKDGQPGVDEYVDFFANIHEESKTKKEKT
ncbi:MAG: hypothetical protein K0S44_207 [Bacteroidetes bacterium]|jgi:hypothetical protein|nr:hypothetical protein [Bacteroidota bacterium]